MATPEGNLRGKGLTKRGRNSQSAVQPQPRLDEQLQHIQQQHIVIKLDQIGSIRCKNNKKH